MTPQTTVNLAWEDFPLDCARDPGPDVRPALTALMADLGRITCETPVSDIYDTAYAIAETLDADGAAGAVVIAPIETDNRALTRVAIALEYTLSRRGIMPLFVDADPDTDCIVLREHDVSGTWLRIVATKDPATRAQLYRALVADRRADEARLRKERELALNTATNDIELVQATRLPKARPDLIALLADMLADRAAAVIIKTSDPGLYELMKVASAECGYDERPWTAKIGSECFGDQP